LAEDNQAAAPCAASFSRGRPFTAAAITLGLDVDQQLLLRLSLNRYDGLHVAVDDRRRRLRGLVDDKLTLACVSATGTG